MKTDYPERYHTLGLKIAYYRKKAGLTQEQLAEQAKLSTVFLAQVEAPGVMMGISLESLFRLADALEVPLSKLVEDD